MAASSSAEASIEDLEWEEWDSATSPLSFAHHCLAGSFAGVVRNHEEFVIVNPCITGCNLTTSLSLSNHNRTIYKDGTHPPLSTGHGQNMLAVSSATQSFGGCGWMRCSLWNRRYDDWLLFVFFLGGCWESLGCGRQTNNYGGIHRNLVYNETSHESWPS